MRIIYIFILLTTLAFADSRALYLKKYKDESRVALVVGNSNYSGVLSKLKNPLQDAKDVGIELERHGFEVMLLLDATQEQMDEALELFSKKLDRSGVGLFYFAGHGLEVQKQNYLVPIGAEIGDKHKVKYRTIALDEVIDRMSSSKARLNMIVLDACRNDPFSRGGGGLAPAITAKGTLIAYATSPGSVASDNPDEDNGLYTKHFLKALKQKNINQRDLFHNVRVGVHNESAGAQTPYLNNGTIGDFYFHIESEKNKGEALNIAADLLLWQEIENSKDYRDFEFFIESYPESKYLALAKLKMNNLGVEPTKEEIYRDIESGLSWQVNIEKRKFTLRGAKRYCARLKIEQERDWRVPTLDELKSILREEGYRNPMSRSGKSYIVRDLLDSTAVKYQWFWSSTISNKNRSKAYHVDFGQKKILLQFTSTESYVRCVK